MPSRDSSARSDQLGFPDIFHSGYDEFLERSVGRTKATATARRRSPRREITTTRKKSVKKRNAEKKQESPKLEAQILKSETALKKYNEQLEIEANHNNLAQINELSKKISQAKREIEDLYREYAG